MPSVSQDGVGDSGNLRRCAIFTVVSNNYLHFARTLLSSVREVHPDADLYCVIVDSDHSFAEKLTQEFNYITIDKLNLPAGDRFLVQYNVLELNTAIKPWTFEFLMRNYDRVVYIDPDIRLYNAMNEVFLLLNNNNDIVITPHLLSPIVDDKRPSELDIRRAGTYNFGFCALASTTNSLEFVRWWQSKLEKDCVIDLDRGIFVDQSWIDLVPGMFERVAVLRHPGYNVAYWNVAQRNVERTRQGRWVVNGQPLVFFHYSGLNPLDPKPFSKHQNRFTLDNLGPSRELVEGYVDELLANGARTYSKIAYGFGRFDDGENIPPFFAELYRNEPALREALGEKPFSKSSVLHDPAKILDGQPVSWAMLGLWRHSVHLQDAFSLKDAASVVAFRHWFPHEAGTYFSPKVVAAHRAMLRAEAQAEATERSEASEALAPTVDSSSSPGTQTSSSATIELGWLFDFYGLILRRFPERTAIEAYSRIGNKPYGRLIVWRLIAFSEENRGQPGWILRAVSALIRLAPKRSAVTAVLPSTPAATLKPHNADSELGREPGQKATDPADQTWHYKLLCEAVPSTAYGGIFTDDAGDAEEGFWAAPLVKLPLPANAGAKTIEITGQCDSSFLEQRTGSRINEIAVYLGSKLIAVDSTDASGKFCLKGSLPDDYGRRPTLHILAKAHFVPAAIGLGDDRRPLAYRLQKIQFGDLSIVDTAVLPPRLPLLAMDYDPPGFNLIGYVRAEHGVGQAARGLAASARAAAISYSVVDVGFQTSNRQEDDAALFAAVEEHQPIDLLCVNADQVFNTMSYLREIEHRADYRIGFWHWEQPVFPKRWHGSFEGLNEIWVPTSFVHEAVSAVSPLPVAKIADAVHFEIPKDVKRSKFGLPTRSFVALVMYDFDSYTYRKNPEAAIAAFRLATKGRKEATLVIKTINADKHPADIKRLKKAVADLSTVIFIDKFLSREEVYELQSCCNVLLSLHRAEGFGLAAAEMMFMGKSVVATGWSGNMDFMTPMNSFPVEYELKPLAKAHGVYEEGPMWAEPDIEHAAWCIKQVIDNPKVATAKARRGAEDVRRVLSPNAVGRQVRERLNIIASLKGLD